MRIGELELKEFKPGEVLYFQSCKTSSNVPVKALQVEVKERPVKLSVLKIVYHNGDQQKFDLNKRLQPGESTEWMDLASEARCVAVMRIEAEPDRRKRGVKDARVVFWAR